MPTANGRSGACTNSDTECRRITRKRCAGTDSAPNKGARWASGSSETCTRADRECRRTPLPPMHGSVLPRRGVTITPRPIVPSAPKVGSFAPAGRSVPAPPPIHPLFLYGVPAFDAPSRQVLPKFDGRMPVGAHGHEKDLRAAKQLEPGADHDERARRVHHRGVARPRPDRLPSKRDELAHLASRFFARRRAPQTTQVRCCLIGTSCQHYTGRRQPKSQPPRRPGRLRPSAPKFRWRQPARTAPTPRLALGTPASELW